ncbi:hypothetical protein KL907_004577 [Ogataea polymorpha]|nr:hypothetical protein KL907_004577 [Ogataea polymorpha]
MEAMLPILHEIRCDVHISQNSDDVSEITPCDICQTSEIGNQIAELAKPPDNRLDSTGHGCAGLGTIPTQPATI